jgi:hypothetical protein
MPIDHDREPVDLNNIDYDDVLHLYRGWRRAETALKERTAECEALKARTDRFEDSHERFRSQIQALESVKDLTISLQSQLNLLQSENAHVTAENRRMTEILTKMDSELAEARSQTYKEQLEAARTEFEYQKQKYNEMLLSHKALETMLANEAAARQSAEGRLASLDEVVNTLRTENRCAWRGELCTTTAFPCLYDDRIDRFSVLRDVFRRTVVAPPSLLSPRPVPPHPALPASPHTSLAPSFPPRGQRVAFEVGRDQRARQPVRPRARPRVRATGPPGTRARASERGAGTDADGGGRGD